MNAPGNVVMASEHPTLEAIVRDPTTDQLEARLRLYRLDGALVHDETFALPPASRCGREH